MAQDELESFSWIRHDGRRFGKQAYKDMDGKTNILAQFAITNDDDTLSNAISWMQKFNVEPTKASETLFMFYFGFDCDGAYRCSSKSHDDLPPPLSS